MSSSDDDFQHPGSSDESSTDGVYSRASSRPASATPISPLKRRRSASADSLRSRKRHLDGKYNNAYRILFNETVSSAAARFVVEDAFHPDAAKIRAAEWSTKEKRTFFAALQRLGFDNVPGIAKAIGTKSILETRQFLFLIQEAFIKRRDTKVTFQDIPAALEVGFECEDRLELAGEALAWYQERFEAKQEQERYGKYWLVTPEIAEEIEEAILACQAPSTASSPRITADQDEKPAETDNETIPQILQDVPEARLLVPAMLLQLSKHFFMNSSPSIPYPWPHWTELVSELAAEPSIYRTALRDFHALVASLTKRLAQAAIIQATSRIRSQGWRVKKGVQRYVKPRDVVTAVDLLGMSRNSGGRWRGVARRCGLRVRAGKRQVRVIGGKRTREMPWDEVERILGSMDTSIEPLSTDAETAGLTSGTEDEIFKSRAVRSGTPLPTARPLADPEEEEGPDGPGEEESSASNTHQPPNDYASDTSSLVDSEAVVPLYDSSEDELNGLEDLDQAASGREERMLWNLLGVSPVIKRGSSHPKEETAELESKKSYRKLPQDTDDWRSWTPYHAEWEVFRRPISVSNFVANQKKPSADQTFRSIAPTGTDSSAETGRSSGASGRCRKRRNPSEAELPIRGTRAYAAVQERIFLSEDRVPGAIASDDDAKIPAQSIEGVDERDHSAIASDDVMDWD